MMAESKGFEPLRRDKPPTRFPIVLLRPARTALQLAPQVGFEPTTDRLTADCSTTELLWNMQNLKVNFLFLSPAFAKGFLSSVFFSNNYYYKAFSK